MTESLPPPSLLELARRSLAGEADLRELEAAIEAWNQAHPESPSSLQVLLAAARSETENTDATRILQTREGEPFVEEKDDDGTRIAAPQGDDEATRLMTAGEASDAPAAASIGTSGQESASTVAHPASREAATRHQPASAATGTTDDSTPPSAPREPEPGDRLKDRFVLESLLGRGGMGAVFKARDLRKEEAHDRDPWIAVKVLSGDFREHPAAFIALQREAKKAQKLAHPNTVTVYDFDRDGPIVFMTMELLEGESLKELLRRHPYGMPFRDVLPIVEGIVSGLAYAHEKGIVHSDLKPGNIFVTREGTVKVLDFGIARALHGSRLHEGAAGGPVSSAGTGQGSGVDATLFDPGTLGALTPAYASCEMLEGKDPDPRDDVYALACVTYELLTGRHPFRRLPADEARARGMTPEPVSKKIPRRAWKALQHGLAFDREARTASVQQFFVELSGRRPGQGMNPRTVALVVMLVLAAGVGLTLQFQPQLEYLWHRLFPTELPPETRAEIADLLEIADLNREAGRLVSPPGSNAYEAYKAVLKLDPWNAQARKGLDKIAEYLLAEANRLYSTEQLDRARLLVEESLRYFPDHKGLRRLDERLKEENPAN